MIVVKGLIWSIALGSGTSGGVLAPLLIMGGALGALASPLLPGGDAALWPLVGMAAAWAARCAHPLTSTIFALELTHDINALPALLIASVVAHGLTVLVMKRSILTEKVARRGYPHHSRIRDRPAGTAERRRGDDRPTWSPSPPRCRSAT